MKFTELIVRLTGISCPIFGVSWNPPEADVTIARRVIAQLEDRRALYTDLERQIPEFCVTSILEIRRDILTAEITKLDTDNELAKNLRAMRAACRRFLTKVESSPATNPGERPYWVTDGTLGELRSILGLHIAIIAVKYGLDLEDELASILPASDDNGEA
jgi:hypothetical protein